MVTAAEITWARVSGEGASYKAGYEPVANPRVLGCTDGLGKQGARVSSPPPSQRASASVIGDPPAEVRGL